MPIDKEAKHVSMAGEAPADPATLERLKQLGKKPEFREGPKLDVAGNIQNAVNRLARHAKPISDAFAQGKLNKHIIETKAKIQSKLNEARKVAPEDRESYIKDISETVATAMKDAQGGSADLRSRMLSPFMNWGEKVVTGLTNETLTAMNKQYAVDYQTGVNEISNKLRNGNEIKDADMSNIEGLKANLSIEAQPAADKLFQDSTTMAMFDKAIDDGNPVRAKTILDSKDAQQLSPGVYKRMQDQVKKLMNPKVREARAAQTLGVFKDSKNLHAFLQHANNAGGQVAESANSVIATLQDISQKIEDGKGNVRSLAIPPIMVQKMIAEAGSDVIKLKMIRGFIKEYNGDIGKDPVGYGRQLGMSDETIASFTSEVLSRDEAVNLASIATVQGTERMTQALTAQYGPERGRIALGQVANALGQIKDSPLAQDQAATIRYKNYDILTDTERAEANANPLPVDSEVLNFYGDDASGLPNEMYTSFKKYAWLVASRMKTGETKAPDIRKERVENAHEVLAKLVAEAKTKNISVPQTGLLSFIGLGNDNSNGMGGSTFHYVNLGTAVSTVNIEDFSSNINDTKEAYDKIAPFLNSDQREIDADRIEMVKYDNGNNGLIAVDEEGNRQTLLDVNGNRIEISDTDINTSGFNAIKNKYERITHTPPDRIRKADLSTGTGVIVLERLQADDGVLNKSIDFLSTGLAKLLKIPATVAKSGTLGQVYNESSMRPDAEHSGTGAAGPFQILVATARTVKGMKDVPDAEISKRLKTDPKFAAEVKHLYDERSMKRIDDVYNSLTPAQRSKVRLIDVLQMKWFAYSTGWDGGYLKPETMIKLSERKESLTMKLTKKVKGKDGKITEVKKTELEAIEQFSYVIRNTAILMGQGYIDNDPNTQLMLSTIADEYGDDARQRLLMQIKKASILGHDISKISGTSIEENNKVLLGKYRG